MTKPVITCARTAGRFARLGSCLLALLIWSSCGGGTKGTGGSGGSEFSGEIVGTSGTSISDALVTLEETGESTTSDAGGQFLLISQETPNKATLLVDSQGTEAAAVIDQIPSARVSVKVKLELDSQKKTLTVTSKTIAPRPAATKPPAAPTAAVPLPTAAPVPPVSTPEPVIPTPAPLPTATPEPTATVNPAPTPTAVPKAFTRFAGSIIFEDPALLPGAQIGVVGRVKHPIGPKGGFAFRVPAAVTNNQIVILTGARSPRLALTGITENTASAKLRLRVRTRPNGTLRIILENIVLSDQPPDPADGTAP